jgi:hypothetical protein
MSDTVKLSANLSKPVIKALRDLSEKRGVSMTEVLRQAISREKYFQDAADRNEKLLLEDTSGRIKQIVMTSSI